MEQAYRLCRERLLSERQADGGGYWIGELSASALSTATAIGALALIAEHRRTSDAYVEVIRRGTNWLIQHQNADGGWGDTVQSFSNISTTLLVRSALRLTATESEHPDAVQRCESWLSARYGPTPRDWAEAVRQRYGQDRTFAVPILTMCSLAQITDWREVPYLPFELACFPQSWYRFLQLPVVSYALPALIAIGQAVHHHRRSWNPYTRVVRWLARNPSLRILERIQPPSGGYLEATPLTSFVAMSLASIGLVDHPVTRHAERFLLDSVREDGSWPIDSNLSVWVTTLSINALAAANDLEAIDRREDLRNWLLTQQGRQRHPYTGAEPGGWGWSHLSGSVPDCDDTPGALLALNALLDSNLPAYAESILQGLQWLLNLQNRDGGWPTFCRGWGLLPFDRSGTDLTAHALRALHAWQLHLPAIVPHSHTRKWSKRIEHAIQAGWNYLASQQRQDGSWLPLWFGNQHAPDDINPTYGTARVLSAYRECGRPACREAQAGRNYLLQTQNTDGGWGGAERTPSSVEETALAVDALIDFPEATPAVTKGLAWLIDDVESGGFEQPSPIGFYFAKLWYFEKLYPVIFATAALGRARRMMNETR